MAVTAGVSTARDSGVMAQLPRVRAPTPVRFIVYAYGITWLVAWPLVLAKGGLLTQQVPFALHYLTAFGPLLAAALVAFGEGETPGVLAWLRSLGRSAPAWSWAVALSPLVVYALVVSALGAVGRPVAPIAYEHGSG